jgi:hypothetical protein
MVPARRLGWAMHNACPGFCLCSPTWFVTPTTLLPPVGQAHKTICAAYFLPNKYQADMPRNEVCACRGSQVNCWTHMAFQRMAMCIFQLCDNLAACCNMLLMMHLTHRPVQVDRRPPRPSRRSGVKIVRIRDFEAFVSGFHGFPTPPRWALGLHNLASTKMIY